MHHHAEFMRKVITESKATPWQHHCRQPSNFSRREISQNDQKEITEKRVLSETVRQLIVNKSQFDTVKLGVTLSHHRHKNAREKKQ